MGEQAGAATITVKRSGGSAGNVTVQYATSDGTAHDPEDYQSVTGTITFDSSGPGATTQTFSVPIVGNGLPDGNRTVNLTLHTPTGAAVLGAQKTAVLTIVDDEVALQFSQASYSAGESAGSATITVTRSGPAGPAGRGDVHGAPGVSYRRRSTTAEAYTGLLPFAANQTIRSFTIPVVNDTLAEGPETVLLQLSSPDRRALLGPRQSAVLTIVDNDAGGAFKFSAASYSASEAAPTANVTVTRSGGSASNGRVRIRTVAGGTAVPGHRLRSPGSGPRLRGGQTSRTVAVTLLTGSNLTDDGARTIKLELDQPEPPGLASVVSPSHGDHHHRRQRRRRHDPVQPDQHQRARDRGERGAYLDPDRRRGDGRRRDVGDHLGRHRRSRHGLRPGP